MRILSPGSLSASGTLLALLLASPARADHKVVMVVPPAEAPAAGQAVAVELKLSHSHDITLISRGAQLEILKGLGLGADAKVDGQLALRLGQLSGADAVILGPPSALQLCQVAQKGCNTVPAKTAAEAATALLTALGAAPAAAPGKGDETSSAAALTAYAACRQEVSSALEQSAVKRRKLAKPASNDACKKAAAADPKFLPARGALAALRSLTGDAASEKDLKEVAAAMPSDPIAPVALIALYADREESDAQAADVTAVQQASVNNLDVYRVLGEHDFAADDYDDALPEFQKALALAPSSPYLHWRLSYTLHMHEDAADALTHAEQASKLSGGDHPFYQEEYASRLMDVGRNADAQPILEKLRAQDPKWGRVALRLGWVLHLQGKSADAIPLLKEAVDATPRDHRERTDAPLARYDLARAYAKLGQADNALQELGKLKDAGYLAPAMLDEKDFDGIRKDPRFAKLTA